MDFELVVKVPSFCVLEKQIEFIVTVFDAIVEFYYVGVVNLFHNMNLLED